MTSLICTCQTRNDITTALSLLTLTAPYHLGNMSDKRTWFSITAHMCTRDNVLQWLHAAQLSDLCHAHPLLHPAAFAHFVLLEDEVHTHNITPGIEFNLNSGPNLNEAATFSNPSSSLSPAMAVLTKTLSPAHMLYQRTQACMPHVLLVTPF